MAEKKREGVKGTSPKGVAKWASLNKPDDKFKKEGEYRLTLVLPPDEAAPLIAVIEKEREVSMTAAKTENPKKRVKMADAPYQEDVNKDGEKTGLIKFNFKAKASGIRKDSSVWSFRPAVFDAKGHPMPKDVLVFGGSVVKVAYEIRHFFTDLIGAGVTLNLRAVQVLDLKTAGGKAAGDFGFGEEEGYESDPAPATPEGSGAVPASGQDF